jgi:hypothetical protein
MLRIPEEGAIDEEGTLVYYQVHGCWDKSVKAEFSRKLRDKFRLRPSSQSILPQVTEKHVQMPGSIRLHSRVREGKDRIGVPRDTGP